MKEQLLSTVKTSHAYTLAVAEAMPDDSYNYKPTGAGWNFRELLHHIAYGIQWWEQNYIIKTQTDWNQPSTKANKKEIIHFLNEAYTSLEKTVNTRKLDDDAIQSVYATIDHVTHHRGQAVVYLRCHGITPPEYTY